MYIFLKRLLGLVFILALIAPLGVIADNDNDDDDDGTCECPKDGSGTGNQSVHLRISCGETLDFNGIHSGALMYDENIPSPNLVSRANLKVVKGGYVIESVVENGYERDVTVRKGSGTKITYHFESRQTTGFPTGEDASDSSYIVMDRDGPVYASPHRYDLYLVNGDILHFSAYEFNDYNLNYITFCGDNNYTDVRQEFGTVKDYAGVLKQVLSPTRLLVIADEQTSVTGGEQFRVDAYPREWVSVQSSGEHGLMNNAPIIESWRVSNVDTGVADNNSVIIRQLPPGGVVDAEAIQTTRYEYNESRNEWNMSKDDWDTFNRYAKGVDIGGNKFMTSRVIGKYPNGKSGAELVQYRKDTIKTKKTWGKPVTQVKEYSSASDILTTDYTYYESTSDAGYKKKATMARSDGYQESYVYYGDIAGEEDLKGLLKSKTVTWIDSQAKIISYTYDDTAYTGKGDSRRRSVTEKVNGLVTKKTFYDYSVNSSTGVRTDTVSLSVDGGTSSGTTLDTVKTFYGSSASDAAKGKLHTVVYPDGTQKTYAYDRGDINEATSTTKPLNDNFNESTSGNASRTIVTHGTSTYPNGIANKTTRSITVKNDYGYVVLEETQVYTGSDYETIDWTVYERDYIGHAVATYYSDETEESEYWGTGCCGKESDVDRFGVNRTYGYDDYKRQEISTKVKSGTSTDITTTYGRDGKGRVTSTTVSVNGVDYTGSSTTYDWRGRTKSSKDNRGLTTSTYYYESTYYRYEKTTYPGGGTRYVFKYKDGRTKMAYGTAVVSEYHEYGVTADGTNGKLWHKVYAGTSNNTSPRWTKTTYDLLGRVESVERPGFGTGVVMKETNHYNAIGQLGYRVTSVVPAVAGISDQTFRMEYNTLGRLVRDGLDLDNAVVAGTLQKASTDRVTEYSSVYEKVSDVWYLKQTTTTYPEDGLASNPIVVEEKQRLTGFEGIAATTDGNLVAESERFDALDNKTVSQTWVNRASKKVTQVMNVPASTADQKSVTVNGVLLSTTSTAAGDVTSFEYDVVERRTRTYDPRTKGTDSANYRYSEVHYNALGQVDWVEDACLPKNRTSFAYDANTGRLKTTTQPGYRTTTQVYDVHGRVTGEYGTASYPIVYKYDNVYGDMVDMYTYRGTAAAQDTLTEFTALANNINANGDSSSMDRTHWAFDPATGLLLNKRYNHTTAVPGLGPEYDYHEDGSLQERTWARNGEGTSTKLKTIYSYYADTRHLHLINYTDTTPDVTFTYDRLGRRDTVEQENGQDDLTYTFGYTPWGAYDSETLRNAAGTVLHKVDLSQQASGEGSGRATGYSLTIGTTPFQTIGYSYDGLGRFEKVTASGSDLATYNYLPGSDLSGGYTTGGVSAYPKLSVVKSYEPHRNLISIVSNNKIATSGATPTILSYFTYINDAAGRRDIRTRSRVGSSTLTEDFGYNQRNEVTGVDVGDNGTEEYGYQYDNIGNRATSRDPEDGTVSYQSSELNQYDTTAGGRVESFDYDDDGNLLSDGTWLYKWNAENRLKEMNTYGSTSPGDGDKRVEFKYDYDGRRYYKKSSRHNGSSWVTLDEVGFVWNGNRIIYQTSTACDDMTFVWGSGGELVSMKVLGSGSNAGTYFYCHDANKNISELVNSSGTIVQGYDYDAYGQRISAEPATGSVGELNPFRFSNEYHDSDTDLVAYKYRYYSWMMGRFISRDPIGEVGGVNMYTFVGNNPVVLVDYLGLTSSRSLPGFDNVMWSFDKDACTLTMEVHMKSRLFKSPHGRPASAVVQNMKKQIESAWNTGAIKITSKDESCVCHCGVTPKVNIIDDGIGYFTNNGDGDGAKFFRILVYDGSGSPSTDRQSHQYSEIKNKFGGGTVDYRGVEGIDREVPPIPHEFGHFLGLQHPGLNIEGEDEYLYDGPDMHGREVDGRKDLMGYGTGLRPFYFKYWVDEMNRVYSGCGYSAEQ